MSAEAFRWGVQISGSDAHRLWAILVEPDWISLGRPNKDGSFTGHTREEWASRLTGVATSENLNVTIIVEKTGVQLFPVAEIVKNPQGARIAA